MKANTSHALIAQPYGCDCGAAGIYHHASAAASPEVDKAIRKLHAAASPDCDGRGLWLGQARTEDV